MNRILNRAALRDNIATGEQLLAAAVTPHHMIALTYDEGWHEISVAATANMSMVSLYAVRNSMLARLVYRVQLRRSRSNRI